MLQPYQRFLITASGAILRSLESCVPWKSTAPKLQLALCAPMSQPWSHINPIIPVKDWISPSVVSLDSPPRGSWMSILLRCHSDTAGVGEIPPPHPLNLQSGSSAPQGLWMSLCEPAYPPPRCFPLKSVQVGGIVEALQPISTLLDQPGCDSESTDWSKGGLFGKAVCHRLNTSNLSFTHARGSISMSNTLGHPRGSPDRFSPYHCIFQPLTPMPLPVWANCTPDTPCKWRNTYECAKEPLKWHVDSTIQWCFTRKVLNVYTYHETG